MTDEKSDKESTVPNKDNKEGVKAAPSGPDFKEPAEVVAVPSQKTIPILHPIPEKSGGTRWTVVEWEFCKENLKDCDSLDEVTQLHANAGYCRTLDAISTKSDKKRHTEIVHIKYSMNRDFKELEIKALYEYMMETGYTYAMIMSDPRQLLRLGAYFTRTSENVKHGIKDNLAYLLEMFKNDEKKGLVNPFETDDDHLSVFPTGKATGPLHSLVGVQMDLPSSDALVSEAVKRKYQIEILAGILHSINPKLGERRQLETLTASLVNCKELHIKEFPDRDLAIATFHTK